MNRAACSFLPRILKLSPRPSNRGSAAGVRPADRESRLGLDLVGICEIVASDIEERHFISPVAVS